MMETLKGLPPNPELQAALDLAAATLAPMADNLRAGWVFYLLEALEALRTHDGNAVLKQDFDDWLDGLRSDLYYRLKTGRW